MVPEGARCGSTVELRVRVPRARPAVSTEPPLVLAQPVATQLAPIAMLASEPRGDLLVALPIRATVASTQSDTVLGSEDVVDVENPVLGIVAGPAVSDSV